MDSTVKFIATIAVAGYVLAHFLLLRHQERGRNPLESSQNQPTKKPCRVNGRAFSVEGYIIPRD